MTSIVERDDLTPGEPPQPPPEPDETGGSRHGRHARRGRARTVAGHVTTALAAVLVFVALVGPNDINHLTPIAFLRIPVEALVLVLVLLMLPPRARRVVAAVAGALLGVVALMKIFDMGFLATLARPFDPVLDWALLDDAESFLDSTIGTAGAIAAAIGAGVLAVAIVVLMTLAVLRLTRVAVRHRDGTTRGVAVLTVAWLVCAVFGLQFAIAGPVASRDAATIAYQKALLVPAGIQDRKDFAAQASVDAFRDTPGSQLLTGLHGKDVLLTFVESYGRSAVEDPALAPQVDAVLDDGTRQLAAAGFTAKSGWLTSPVTGGGSWLAESTFLSGLWIDNQQRYRDLVSSDRLTLPSAFKKASWPTVAVMPATTTAWPEGKFYGVDRVYDMRDLGYKGSSFSWSPMPDQYTLSQFQSSEYGKPGRDPLMAEIVLTSSHVPWAPIPELVDWNSLGDGSQFTAMAKAAKQPDEVWKDADQVRAEYGRSIQYSLNTLISYVKTYGNDNLVLVFLGDHQPAPVVTGENASHDVPITIVAHDPAVLNRISSWGWQDGLRPGPQTPVWRMDTFRDRFLSAYGPS